MFWKESINEGVMLGLAGRRRELAAAEAMLEDDRGEVPIGVRAAVMVSYWRSALLPAKYACMPCQCDSPKCRNLACTMTFLRPQSSTGGAVTGLRGRDGGGGVAARGDEVVKLVAPGTHYPLRVE